MWSKLALWRNEPFVQGLDRDALSTLGSTCIDHFSPILRRHSLSKAVSSFSRYIAGLESAFHVAL